ncbi:hypothetical protein BpHYR1_018766, partial [Brachionus plicatilis]
NSVYNRNEISTVFLSRPSKIAIFIIFPLNTEETFQSLKMLIWSLCQELIINNCCFNSIINFLLYPALTVGKES